MGKLLSDGRQFLLNTDAPTYIDFTFASLAALTVFPEGFCGRVLSEQSKIRFEGITDKRTFTKAKEYRKTPAGKFALRMYKDHRFSKM